jgi:hypothetical protein
MKRAWSVFAAGALLAFQAGTAHAQLSITPLVGGYIPGSSIKEVRAGASNVAVEREGTLALGLNIETGMLRVGAAYASGTTIQDANQQDLGKGTVLTAAADIVLRPLPRIIVQPYALGGVGLKNLSYDEDTGIAGAFPKDTRELALHAGLGADAMFGPIGIVAELTDFISRDANDKWKIHDAFLMAGIKIRL